jgi:hypothetical protein
MTNYHLRIRPTRGAEDAIMSLETILAELPALTEEERKAVSRQLYELSVDATRKLLEHWESLPPLPRGHWTKVFEEWTGKGEEDVPEDFSLNLDHYIYGVPKRW